MNLQISAKIQNLIIWVVNDIKYDKKWHSAFVDWKNAKITTKLCIHAWVKVFRIISEFRILRLTFHKKSKCRIRKIIIGFPIYIQSV